MRRETHELAWRIKLVLGLALLGVVTGSLLYLHFMIFNRELQVLPRYGLAVWNSFTLDAPGAPIARRELLLSAAAGAALLTAPALWLMLRPRGPRGTHHF